jgi:hypothetical protein
VEAIIELLIIVVASVIAICEEKENLFKMRLWNSAFIVFDKGINLKISSSKI